jgi:hypothetical protein
MFGHETRMLLRHYLEQGTSKERLWRGSWAPSATRFTDGFGRVIPLRRIVTSVA